MFRCQLKKLVIYALIFCMGVLNTASVFLIAPRASAADTAENEIKEPRFEFGDESWYAKPGDIKTVNHGFTYYDNNSGTKHTARATYNSFHMDVKVKSILSTDPNYGKIREGDQIDLYHIDRTYAKDGSTDNFSHQSSQYSLMVINTKKPENLIRGIGYLVDCKEHPNITIEIEKQNPLCFNTATGEEPDSTGDVHHTFLNWYINKTNEHLRTGDHQLGSGASDYSPPETFPSECTDMIISPSSDYNFADLDSIAQASGAFDKSPFRDKARDLELYKRYYASDMTLNYSDMHFDYNSFLDDYQSAIGIISNYWKKGEGDSRFIDALQKFFEIGVGVGGTVEGSKVGLAAGKKGAGMLKSAASKVKQAVGLAKPPISTWTVTGGEYAASTTTAAAGASGSSIVKGALVAASPALMIGMVGGIAIGLEAIGIQAFKNHEDQDAWAHMFELIDAQDYAAAHLAFHGCMVDHEVKGGGFSKENLIAETERYTAASKLIDDALRDIAGWQNEIVAEQNEDTCGIDVDTNLVGRVFFNALGGALCAIINMFAGFTRWVMEHIYGSVFDAYLRDQHPPAFYS